MYTPRPATGIVCYEAPMIDHHLNVQAEETMSAYELLTPFLGSFDRYVGAIDGSHTVGKLCNDNIKALYHCPATQSLLKAKDQGCTAFTCK